MRARKRCSVDGCTNNTHAKGVCQSHGPRCSVDGCTNSVNSKGGVCKSHGPRCSVDGCNNNANTKGVCQSHGPRCPVDGCTNNVNSKGVCKPCHGALNGCCPECRYVFTPDDGTAYVRAKTGARTYCLTCQPYGTGEWVKLARKHIDGLHDYPYGYGCVYGCGNDGTHGDHVFPKSVWPEFANEPWNLVPACRDHNHDKSARDPLEWLETVPDSAPFWDLLKVSALGQMVRLHRAGNLRGLIREEVA